MTARLRVAIAGAGNVGRSIANELLDRGHEVLLIERDPRAMKVHSVPRATWLHADACELSSLEEAGLDGYSVVVAATGDDKVEPGRVAAGQDRVRGSAHGCADQSPQERMAVQRGVGRGRVGVHAAHDDRPRRGGSQRGRPGPADAVHAGAGVARGVHPELGRAAARRPDRRRDGCPRTAPWSRSCAAGGSSCPRRTTRSRPGTRCWR